MRKISVTGLCVLGALPLCAGITSVQECWTKTSNGMLQNGQAFEDSSTSASVTSNVVEGTSFDPVADVLALSNKTCSTVVRASANYTGLLLDSVRRDSSGFEKKFSLILSDEKKASSYSENWTDGTGASQLLETTTLSSNICHWTVSCAWQMPVSPDVLYGLGESLKSMAWRSECLQDGCYFYLGEFMGVSPTAWSATWPASLRRVFATCLVGCGNLYTLIVNGPIVNIEHVIFDDCTNLRTLVAGDVATARAIIDLCPSICELELMGTVTTIEAGAFEGCANLRFVKVPDSVVEIGDRAFARCSRLTNVLFSGDAPEMGENVFYGTPRRMVLAVPQGSIGWDGTLSVDLPGSYQGRPIVHSDEKIEGGQIGVTSAGVSVTVTNAVVHYIQQSLSSEMVAPISTDTGIVNVMTEIEGNSVAIPDSWAENYPDFTTRFGTDFTSALTKQTGKVGSGGTPLMVWQDYVAGTDPTDEKSVFTASVTLVGGKPVVSYSPVLTEAEAAKRLYRTWGKVQLTDAEWTEIVAGTEGDYNFFKVTVEMRK